MNTIKEKLQNASEGLWMMSESDYEFTYFKADGNSINEELVLELAEKPPGTSVEKTDVDYLFRNMVKQDFGFVKLAEVLKSELNDLEVYRVGEVQVQVFIIGKAEGRILGLKTLLIET